MSSTHSQVNLEIQAPPSAENVLIKDGDLIIPSSSTMFEDTQKPAKKQTRQWAAWTRQEEENFFNALRQVGKNFEKITYRVQSKNKDQVRHYYYRLVRRMNKLLGPGLCLDAKNSKDTVAAMLRWWSLLEKFSCTASKLHLRPRRFKIFVETLENQLLKDRNKTRRKRPSPGENCLATSSTSLISKAPASDARPVKLVVVDSQNTHKIGATKGTSLKRNVSPSVNFNKRDLSTMKTVRQKRRPGVASAAYRRWEKAAMAGVSLVADAAEQLERAANDRNYPFDRGTFNVMSTEMYTIDGQKDIDSVGKTAYCFPSPELIGMCSHQIRESTVQLSMKLKLQLFPIDEGTRKALEKDAHNPHLELTLSARKRISSVLEHLNRKWGNSTIASGELMLFPYSVQQEDIASHQRWTVRDTDASAADVYANIGSPSVFRLRYGWFSSAEIGSGIVHVSSPTLHFDNCNSSKDIQKGHAMDVPDAETVNVDSTKYASPTSHISEPVESSKDQSTSGVALVSSVIDTAEPLLGDCFVASKDGPPNSSGEVTSSWLGKRTLDASSMTQQEDVVNLGMRNHATLSAGEWADSLTTISVGDLLSEASKAADSNYVNSSAVREFEQIPFSCDSFDAAIAAHVSGHQLSILSTEVSHASIWNAEETCDGFSFQMVPAFRGESLDPSCTSTGACRQISRMNSLGHCGYLEDFPESGPSDDPAGVDLKTDPECAKELSYDDKYDPTKDICPTDIYWPDSLGPLELDMPSSRYQGQELILGESISLGGLSRLIASSVDAFQSCSFFGMDKKDMSASEARGASFLDNKIGQ